MKNNNINFEKYKKTEFCRVDAVHLLDLYLGKDDYSRPTLELISLEKPLKIRSSQYINVRVYLRKDNRWSLSFSLVDNNCIEIFTLFCQDMINSSRIVSSKKSGMEFLCNRYKKWQEMLAKNNCLLSFEEIKGLIGELYFLSDYMIPHYGAEQALKSWIGPEGANQDFVIGDTWYEVKSISVGSVKVNISSAEQLDTKNNGSLLIIFMEKTSSENSNGYSLNSIVDIIFNSLQEPYCKELFSDILLRKGYFKREEYNEPVFCIVEINEFLVDNNFPVIRRNQLPVSVGKIKYELLLDCLKPFKRTNT